MIVGLIGYGYWGRNLARNFFNAQEFYLKVVADNNPEQLVSVANLYPSIKTTTHSDELIFDSSIELIIIASPVKTHYELVKKALINNKHVLVEKPMTSTFEEAKELVELAQKQDRFLIIDYTYLYSGAVRKLKELFSTNQLGSITSIQSSRLGLGIIRDDVSVFGDLSSHDLAITNYLLNATPIAVKAEMTNMNDNHSGKKAVMTVYYPNQVEARFESSWYSTSKKRKMTFYGQEKTIKFDDTLAQNKIELIEDSSSSYPSYETKESLALLVSDLYKGIKNNQPFLSDGKFGLTILSVIEAAHLSLKNKGEVIHLQSADNLLLT